MVAKAEWQAISQVRQRAERFSKVTGRTVDETIPALLMLSGQVFSHLWNIDTPIEELSDEDVIAISNLHMISPYDERYSELLYEQQARELTDDERYELDVFMRVYEIGLLSQAQALAEAVQRGLREPLEP